MLERETQDLNKIIPVNEPIISQESKNNVNEALESGWISSAGKYVNQFEKDFSHYLGLEHGIAVTNGTAALHLALLASDIGPGDEVIVPAFTMAATWLAVLYTGAKPVFVDAEPITYNLDANQIEGIITSKTKAIMPVHIYGHPAEMDKIMALAGKYNLLVIEDAAEAHGAEYHGQKCGTIGQIGCFSFYGNKIITTGEGGMVVTDNQELAAKVRKFKDLHHSATRFIHDGVGYNYRMTNLQAAIGCGELQHIDEYIEKKRWMARTYSQLLSKIPGLILPEEQPDTKNVYWMYAVQVIPEKFGKTKDELRTGLKQQGVETRDFFYSPSKQPVLQPYLQKDASFPVTEQLAQYGLYLPSGLAITDEQIIKVAEKIIGIYLK